MERGKVDLIVTMTDEELAQTSANMTANFQEPDVLVECRRIDLDTLVTVQVEQVYRQASQ